MARTGAKNRSSGRSSAPDSLLSQTVELSSELYHRLVCEIILNEQHREICLPLLQSLLSEHRAVFSADYGNFFRLMSGAAPRVLFYMMQIQEFREIYLCDDQLALTYHLYDRLIKTSDRYNNMVREYRNVLNDSNESVQAMRSLVNRNEQRRNQAPEDRQFDAFDELVESDARTISGIGDPTEEINYFNTRERTRIDGRTTQGRELKNALQSQMGDFAWDDLPKPVRRRKGKMASTDDKEIFAGGAIGRRLSALAASKAAPEVMPAFSHESNEVLSARMLLGAKGRSDAPEVELESNDAPSPEATAAAAALFGLKTDHERVVLTASDCSEYVLGEVDSTAPDYIQALSPSGGIYASAGFNSHAFAIMDMLSRRRTFGALENRRENKSLAGLEGMDNDENLPLTFNVRASISAIADYMQKERNRFSSIMMRFTSSNRNLSTLFGQHIQIITVDATQISPGGITLEDQSVPCFIIRMGRGLNIRPDSLADSDDSVRPWLTSALNNRFLVTSGLQLRSAAPSLEGSEFAHMVNEASSRNAPYNQWKLSLAHNCIYEGVYQVKFKRDNQLPLTFDDQSSGPFDLVYIRL